MSGYTLTAAAERELREILLYIRDRDGADRALRVLDSFHEVFGTIAASPGIGRLRRHLTGESLRWHRVHRYLVLYDPEPRPIIVMRILHGARDLDRIFGAGE